MDGFGTDVRRTRPRRRTARVVGVALATLLAGGGLAGAGLLAGGALAGANAATTSASTNCVVDSGAQRTTTAGLGFDLDAPSEVAPGESLRIAGTLTVSFPDSFRQAARFATASNARLQVRKMAAEVTVGDQRLGDVPISFTTPSRSLSESMTYTVPVTVADLQVPDSAAGGAVTVTLHGNDYTSNRAGTSPGRVAIDGLVLLDGLAGDRTIGCSFPQSPPQLARVAVSEPPPEPTPGDGSGDGSGAGDGAGAGDGTTDPATGTGTDGSGTDTGGSDLPDGTTGPGGDGAGLGTGSPGGFFAPGPGNSPRPSLDFLDEPQGVFGTPSGSAPPTSGSPSPDSTEGSGGDPLASGDTAFVDLPPQTRTGAGWPSWQMSLLIGLVVAAGAGALLWTRIRLAVLRRRAE